MDFGPTQESYSNSTLIAVQQGGDLLGIALLITICAITYARGSDEATSSIVGTKVPNLHSSLSSLGPRSISASTGELQGVVMDMRGAAVPTVRISVMSVDTGLVRTLSTDASGFYKFVSLPVGTYQVSSRIVGFKTQIVDGVVIEVGKTLVLDIELTIGEFAEEVRVGLIAPLVDLTTVSVGQVVAERTVQEMPLNGRYLTDLGLLVPGSVTPPQNGFLSPPTRGSGSLALNTAGNREDTVNFQINGVTLNDQVNNVLTFNPPLTSIREFKIENSTFSAEHGRNSGAIVNVVTRSGTKDFHGEIYEYFRNDALDARNYFNFVSPAPPPFKRNQFGFALSGPLILPRFGEGAPTLWSGKNGTFFFFNYESLQQRQGVNVNSVVLSDTQREAISDPVIRGLLPFIPPANVTDAGGSPRFVGSARAVADVNQFSVDLSHTVTPDDILHIYYAYQDATRTEPIFQGTTLPGFGDIRSGTRQLFTIEETHIFNQDILNSVRFGFNRIPLATNPATDLDPSTLGINVGVNKPQGLPQINIAGAFNFGGPLRLPGERTDTTLVFADTINYQLGSHSLKFGGEYRDFFNNNNVAEAGAFNFPSVAAFMAGNANSFSINLGSLASYVRQSSLGFFIQDSYRVRKNLTLDLGVRYDISLIPTELESRFVVFDPVTASLLRVGRDIDKPFESDFSNVQPRVGLAWDPFGKGRTSIRAAYAIMVEQPITNAIANTALNPPHVAPLSYTGIIRLDNAATIATAAGLSPITVDYALKNSNVQTWNLNVQHEIVPDLALMIGYFGSKGTHLRFSRNINQPRNGVRPFPRLSASSPELPNAPIGNIVQIESNGNSSYNALWASLAKRFSHGFQFNASYTFSKSIDYNSLSSPPQIVTFQDSYNVRNDRGLSDFDARHRFVLSAIYELPLKGNRFLDGWQIGAIAQSQGGNPVNIVTSSSAINGAANTVRPDVVGEPKSTGTVDQWFDPAPFTAVPHFGNLGRNVVVGPGFHNLDMSLIKDTRINERFRVQSRFEVFDVFNNANFGQPGRVVASSSFAQVTNTRFPTGDSGSSRQLQFGIKVMF